MNEVQTDSNSEQIKPTDPDMHWTGWALDTLREAVGIDMRTKRSLSTQQLTAPRSLDETPDFALMQARLTRSVRLSIAMTERIRADYLLRREKRKDSGEQERRRQRRDQVVEAAVKAVAAPDKDWDADYVRSAVREKLVEDEILDEQLDMLSPAEFVQAVCRKIGRPPASIPLPQVWDDEATADDTVPVVIAGGKPAAGWPRPVAAPVTGRPLPKPLEPDSS
ncbi:hypothetical protein [Inquilinus sp.]|jgi:hypothetical protein|uniref:hypothetical protein n=1 Tax=Inquilinus sp. TaxID=1932117 RepID=UPI003783C0AA